MYSFSFVSLSTTCFCSRLTELGSLKDCLRFVFALRFKMFLKWDMVEKDYTATCQCFFRMISFQETLHKFHQLACSSLETLFLFRKCVRHEGHSWPEFPLYLDLEIGETNNWNHLVTLLGKNRPLLQYRRPVFFLFYFKQHTLHLLACTLEKT